MSSTLGITGTACFTIIAYMYLWWEIQRHIRSRNLNSSSLLKDLNPLA